MAEAAARQELIDPPPPTVTLRSERFGVYEVPLERVITFREGLIGLPEGRRFALLEPARAASPFRYLVCLDVPELGFLVCDPEDLWPGYLAELPHTAAQRQGIAVLAIVTVPENRRDMTVNLMAPLLVDGASREGTQVVIDTGRFSTRHPLLPPAGATAAGTVPAAK